MELTVRHLISRSGIYYFRYRLPGKNLEIKVSLRTGDLKKAVATGKLVDHAKVSNHLIINRKI